jgi:hypothetical protein
MSKRLGCLPTPQQELLLRASLLEGQEARAAWQQWLAQAEIDMESPTWTDQLDAASYRLLPLLFMNIGNIQPIEAPLLDKLKEAYLIAFCRNQSLFNRTIGALRELKQAGIETILLKGAALALLHYNDVGLRPMVDIDVLVPTNKADDAIKVLSKSGWQPGFKAPHSQAFRSTTSGVEIDLHWHALIELSGEDSDDELWNGAVKAELNDLEVLALNPTDTLFHVCAHGMKWEGMPTFRWVADAYMVLKSGATIDWTRLVQFAKKHRLTLPLKEALIYLKELLNPPIPFDVIAQLQSERISLSERLYYYSRTAVHSERNPLLTLWAYYSEYEHFAKSHGGAKGIIGFPAFLKHLWGLDDIWQVPHKAAKGLANRSIASIKKQFNSAR